jgi:hypothetical protein
MNSHDVALFQSFLQTYCIRDFVANLQTYKVVSDPINEHLTIFGYADEHEVLLIGLKRMLMYFYVMNELCVDNITSLDHTEILTRSDSNATTLVLHCNFKFSLSHFGSSALLADEIVNMMLNHHDVPMLEHFCDEDHRNLSYDSLGNFNQLSSPHSMNSLDFHDDHEHLSSVSSIHDLESPLFHHFEFPDVFEYYAASTGQMIPLMKTPADVSLPAKLVVHINELKRLTMMNLVIDGFQAQLPIM